MRVNQYSAFILAVAFALGLFYFTVISSFFSRASFAYQLGTSATQPLQATETSDGVVVSFRALENGVVAKFSLKGEKLKELMIGDYPAVTSAGDDIFILDDSSRKLVKTDSGFVRGREVVLDNVPLRRLYATRSQILLPVKQEGRNVLEFYDLYLDRMNMASLPAPPVMSDRAYAYSYNGSCYVGMLEGDITEIPQCNSVAIAMHRDIFVLIDGKRVVKLDSQLEILGEKQFPYEGKYITAKENVYVASETKLAKYDTALNDVECGVCGSLQGSNIFGFSDGGSYVLSQSGKKAFLTFLD